MSFGFLIFPDVEELDFVGPWEIIGTWSKFYGGPKPCLVVAQSKAPITCANGLSVNPHVTFDECPPLQYLLVPGGQGSRVQVDNPVFIDFIRKQAAGCKAMLSVCTGSFLLERAGLLANKKATTHWGELGKLRKLPLEVVEERIVRNGNVWTAAGVSSGTDLALAFIESEAGADNRRRSSILCRVLPVVPAVRPGAPRRERAGVSEACRVLSSRGRRGRLQPARLRRAEARPCLSLSLIALRPEPCPEPSGTRRPSGASHPRTRRAARNRAAAGPWRCRPASRGRRRPARR